MTQAPEPKRRGRKPEPAQAVAARVAALKQRREDAGLVRCTVWARPEHHMAIKAFAAGLTDSPTDSPRCG